MNLNKHKRLLVSVMAVSLLATGVTTASAAPGRPRIISPDQGNTVHGNPVLRWEKVSGAAKYAVQVSHQGVVVYSVLTYNTMATPPDELPLGLLEWSVAGVDRAGRRGTAARVTFRKSAELAPRLINPQTGAQLRYPVDPPVFHWEPVPGATSYIIEVDDERNFIDPSIVADTENTFFTVPETQTIDQVWYWRVKANLRDGTETAFSQTRTYQVTWNERPTLKTPADTIASTVEDIVFEWDPVLGADGYELEVSPNGDWAHNVVLHEEDLLSTRYSPNPSLNNGSYFWRVRALDTAGGNVGPWSPEQEFRRAWPDRITPSEPADGATAAEPEFAWDPIDHAAFYQLEASADRNFSPGSITLCETQHTRLIPTDAVGGESNSCLITGSGTFFWRVKGVDDPGSLNGSVNGLYTTPRRFTLTPRPEPGTGSIEEPVTGKALRECFPNDRGECTQTPVMEWDYLPGAAKYLLYMAVDPDFTNTVDPSTGDNCPWLNPDERDGCAIETSFNKYLAVSSLLDNQAGESYYWFVRPCGPEPEEGGEVLCGPFDNEVFPQAQSFRKSSIPVKLDSPGDGDRVDNQVTFKWEDYLLTNTGPGGFGAEDEAEAYHIQVSTKIDFSNIIDDRVVDQTTYTASDMTYPEGPLYWRVQAVDHTGHELTFSCPKTALCSEELGLREGRLLTKASPPVTLTSPFPRTLVTGLPVFTWAPQPYAASYEIEVFSNADKNFSESNKVIQAATEVTAFTPEEGLELGTYSWRVRGIDSGGNNRAWSRGRLFTIIPFAPTLLHPKLGIRLEPFPLFQWTAAPRAESYQWIVATDPFFVNVVRSVRTVMTVWAPTKRLTRGVYYWTVLPFDSAGRPGINSNISSFGVGRRGAGPHNRFVKLTLLGGGRLLARGRIAALRSECLKGRVLLQRFDGARFDTVKTVTTNKAGTYSTSLPNRTGSYRAFVPRDRQNGRRCGAAVSQVKRHEASG